MSIKITKKNYRDYSMLVSVRNALSHQVADLQAHIQFLNQTGNTEALTDLSNQFGAFVDKVTRSYFDTLSDDE